MKITLHNVAISPFECEVPEKCPDCDLDFADNAGMLRVAALSPTAWMILDMTNVDDLTLKYEGRPRHHDSILVGMYCKDCMAEIAPLEITAVVVGPCTLASCDNQGRYNSGYCGIHDILYNNGKGELIGKSIKEEEAPTSPG